MQAEVPAESPAPAPEKQIRNRWHLSGLIGGAIAATVAFFYRAVFTDEIFISRDVHRVYYPFKKYWAERVASGEFPDWFPYDGLGQPFAGIVISGVFHPSNLLYLVLPIEQGIKLNILLCFPIALVGAFVFARRLGMRDSAAAVAGILFAFNGYMIGITNNILYLQAAATFPWAFVAADAYFRKPSVLRALGFSVLLALVLFAGDSQSFAVCAVGTAFIALLRRQPGRGAMQVLLWTGAMLLTAVIAAVQIVPAFHVLSQGKPGAQPLEIALTWSMHPLRLLEVVFGPIFGGEFGSKLSGQINRDLLQTQMATLWVESLHLGLPALLFAGVGLLGYRRSWKSWAAAGVAAVLLLLILGKHTGVYGVLFDLVPLWRPFRYPEKLFPYFAFLVSVGAGFGLQEVLRSERVRRVTVFVLAAAGLVSLAVSLQEFWIGGFGQRFISWYWEGAPEAALARLQTGLRNGTLQTAFTCFGFAAILQWLSGDRVGRALVPVALFAQLFVSNGGVYEVTFPDLLREPPAFVSEVRRLERDEVFGRARVLSAVESYAIPDVPGMAKHDRYSWYVASALEPDTPALWDIESGNGYLPGVTQRIHNLMKQGRTWFTRYTGLFNIRYMSMAAEFYEEIGGRADVVVAEQPPLRLVLLGNPTAKERAFLAHPRCVSGEEESLALMPTSRFQPDHQALFECGEGDFASEGGSAPVDGRVHVISYAPERIEVQVETQEQAVLVLNDAFYSGWTASVSGEPVQIKPANHAVRGVLVPAGAHDVVFSYRTPGLMAGAAVSGGGLLLFLLVGLLGVEKRHSK